MVVPRHVAIILDGNGRWAKAKGMPRTYGHVKGCDNLEKVCTMAKELGIKYLTVYAFSTENWKRSREEVDGLMKLFRNYMKKCIKISRDNKMRVRVIGDPRAFDQDLQDKIRELEEYSSQFDDPLILGCDSMFLLDGECYGKPHSEAVARERLRAMRGATGELWTGHCLIDFATGRMVRGASKATLHFCEYSDLDIERYIATGEPLEVAGSFTLEGFGGAFIDSIEGDPHGIIGLSLPLVRRLAAGLGVEWTDLWNVTREDQYPRVTHDAKTGAAKPLPPKENVHQPGDGWVDCACGRKHWGINGASGVLLARRDEETGKVTHIGMQHRVSQFVS